MLKQSLTANALFSGSTGLLILWQDAWIDRQIPAPDWLWMALGVGLIVFSLQLVAMVVRPDIARKLTLQVVASDIGWVVASLFCMALFFSEISSIGIAMISAINVVVGSLAMLQFRGYKNQQLTPSP